MDAHFSTHATGHHRCKQIGEPRHTSPLMPLEDCVHQWHAGNYWQLGESHEGFLQHGVAKYGVDELGPLANVPNIM